MKKIGILIITLIVSSLANGQIKFDIRNFNYGTVESWKNQEAVFSFQNTSSEDLVFLPMFPSNDLYVKLPKGKIKAGAKGEIVVQYYTSSKGPFLKKFGIYVDKKDKPVKLSISGIIKDIAYDAYTSCPKNLSSEAAAPLMAKIEFRVIDSETHEPIPQAKIEYYSGSKLMGVGFTRLNGQTIQQIEVGLYNYQISKEGFKPVVQREQYWNQNTDLVIVTLERDSLVKEEEESMMIAEAKDSIGLLKNIFETVKTNEVTPVDLADFDDKGLLSEEKFKANNVVFLIDISNSMRNTYKLPLLKTAIIELITVMRSIDKVTVISYSSNTNIVLNPTFATEKEIIIDAINSLTTGGITRGQVGVNRAYETLAQNFISEGNNQILLATDGKFTEISKNEKNLYKMVREGQAINMKLSVIGFGQDSEADKFMKSLAKNGGGSYMKINREADVNEILIQEIKSKSVRINSGN